MKFKDLWRFKWHKKGPKMGFSNEVGVFREKPRLAFMLPWAFVDKNGIVHGKDHSLMAVLKFRGPDMESSTELELMQYNAAVNNVIKMLPTGVVLYFEAQRHAASEYQEVKPENLLVQMMEDERAEYYGGQHHYETEFYFTIFMEPPQMLKSRLTNLFIEDKKTEGKADIRVYLDWMEKFMNRVDMVARMLSLWFPDIRLMDDSETISYLHTTVSTLHRHKMKVNPYKYLPDYLCDSDVLGGQRMKLGDKHMRAVTILNYAPLSSPGTFDVFNHMDLEYRWVSRFICQSKEDSMETMKYRHREWNQEIKDFWVHAREAFLHERFDNEINEGALMNREDVTECMKELSTDDVSYGNYTMTMLIFDEDEQHCEEKANMISQAINSSGFSSYVETINSMEAWWGSIPGCYRANLRQDNVNSLNFCHLAPITSLWSGDKWNKHLKGPVLLYTDTSGFTPFRLSLHIEDVGHTMICGPSGSGKSVLLNTLEAHFLKYPDSNVFIFDKAASSRALTLAVGGNFYNIAAEGKGELSFQPLADIEDEQEIKWAKEWVLAYLRQKNVVITPAKDNFVWKALCSLREFPKQQRTISTFCEMVQDQEIRQALVPLTMKGSYGKLFDNSQDISGEGHWQVYEMETVMNTPAIVPTVLDYLFHRIERKLRVGKGPSLLTLDEAWLFFDNDIFRAKLREYFKDFRKKNTSIIFATQNLSDLANKPELLSTVVDNCPTRIFLPNSKAMTAQNQELYKMFDCNEKQISIISRMTKKQDYYYSSEKGNRVFRLALRPAEIPFVTATSKQDQQEINRLLLCYGRENFLEEWLRFKGYEEEWETYQQAYLQEKAEAAETGSPYGDFERYLQQCS